MKLVWKKVKEAEPGLYLMGGFMDPPQFMPHAILAFTVNTKWTAPRWLARIGDTPEEPEMPKPDLKDGDPVWVLDEDDDEWQKRHFAGWTESGRIETWYRGSRWVGNGEKMEWNHYRLPTAEELA